MNKVQIIGNCGKDPEFRTFQSGDKVANLTVATSERWKDKQSGEQKERTTWHNVSVTNPALVKLIEAAVQKGTKLYIEGQLETREYEKDGQKRFITEIAVKPYRGEIEICSGGKPRQEQVTNVGAQPANPHLDDETPY